MTNWFVYDFDREELEERARKWGGLIAGGLFGCGTCSIYPHVRRVWSLLVTLWYYGCAVHDCNNSIPV